MTLLMRSALGAALLCGLSGLTALAGTPGDDGHDIQIVMTPGQGLPMDVGGKKLVGYFEQQGNACGLTIVLSESQMGGMAAGGTEGPHGTRITTEVVPGRKLRIDGDRNRAAEFLCGPEGRKMNARIYTREAYPGKSASGLR